MISGALTAATLVGRVNSIDGLGAGSFESTLCKIRFAFWAWFWLWLWLWVWFWLGFCGGNLSRVFSSSSLVGNVIGRYGPSGDFSSIFCFSICRLWTDSFCFWPLLVAATVKTSFCRMSWMHFYERDSFERSTSNKRMKQKCNKHYK